MSQSRLIANRYLIGRVYNVEEKSSGVRGIPSTTYRRLRTVLLDCGPFSADHELNTVFIETRLTPWRNRLPQATNPIRRVESVIYFLFHQHNDEGKNALVLLLRVLSERLDSKDACHHDLLKLADELEQVAKRLNSDKLKREEQQIQTFPQGANTSYLIDYPSEALVGRGVMGNVYQGIDSLTGQIVAIKALKPEMVNSSPDLVTRFVREGKALRQLNHPNIVKMLDSVEELNQHYLIMEFVQGGTLRDRIDADTPIPLDHIFQIALGLTDALTRAHSLNIIHRDLKPANVLIEGNDTPKLTDFGIAHMSTLPNLTQTGMVVGTPHYLSPEACNGEKVDTRADIWSLGIILFEMLTGKLPFTGSSFLDTVMAILSDPVPDIKQYRPDVNPDLIKLINQMLEKDRKKRTASVRLVGSALEAIVQGRPADIEESKQVFPLMPSLPSPTTSQYTIGSKQLNQLHQKLIDTLAQDELRQLCRSLDISYSNLPGSNHITKIGDLVALLHRNGRIPQLVDLCQQQYPQVIWTFQARLFICYKRHAPVDSQLALYLYQKFLEQGHNIFIDQSMRSGTAWLEEIDQQIQRADFLVVLLSRESADSEMVQSEIRRAYDYRKRQNHPDILPIRVAHTGLLPYSIDAFLNPLQYIIWQSLEDNERVSQEILQAIDKGLPEKQPLSITRRATELNLSEDGRYISHETTSHPPLPEFDPRFLDELPAPGGTVKLRDKFYVERDEDTDLKRQIIRPGSITTIRAPRQSGKSSLLVRGVHHAQQQQAKIINLDLQSADLDQMDNPDIFLRYLAEFIVRRLHLDPGEVRQMWRDTLGPQDKLTYLLEDYVLPQINGPIILAMDEIDRLLETPFYTSFFGLIRSWHNRAAYGGVWENLNVVMVISTEPYLLIADVNQSPFNVGLKLYLKDFTPAQVQDLNQRHSSPVSDKDFTQFLTLLNGHPYLTRKALYTLVVAQQDWPTFMATATTDRGPFSDHLRRQLWLLRNEPHLVTSLKQIVRHNRCDDEAARFRLLRAGLIHASGDVCTCRCDLYRQYFEDKL